MSNRSIWVDYAKAIGIILVVYGHVIRGIFKAGLPIDTDFYRLSDSIVYSFHMPLFFALSGLFFYKSLSKRGVAGLIGSKIDTVIYPYLIWSIIQGVIEASLSSYTNGNVTYREVFSLLWQPRAQFWFLYALFIIFVVASVLFSKLSVKSILPVFVFLIVRLLPVFFYFLLLVSSFFLALPFPFFFVLPQLTAKLLVQHLLLCL